MQAKNALLHIIAQMSELLSQLKPHEYRQPLPEYDGSTLGRHFRHIIEFFTCLEKGLVTGMIDYAARERNLMYEDMPSLAISVLASFAESIENMNVDQTVQMRAEFGNSDRPLYSSTVGRELAFVYDHAIHHLAIIKIGLHCHFPHIQADRNLGVSPSTIKWRQQSTD